MKITLEGSLYLNGVLLLAFVASLGFGLVQYSHKNQYKMAFENEQNSTKKECKKLYPCEPCKKCPTKEEVRAEVLKEIVEGDIIKASLPKEAAKLLFPEPENKSIELSSQ